MKCCADIYQDIPFFNDIKTKESFDEVVHLKIDNGGEPYLHARGLALSAHETTLNIEKVGFHLIGLTPKKAVMGMRSLLLSMIRQSSTNIWFLTLESFLSLHLKNEIVYPNFIGKNIY